MRSKVCYSRSEDKNCRKWMLDSGASVNMIRTSDLTAKERKHIGPLKNPCRLVSANGVIDSNVGISFNIPELGITDEVHICDSAPKGIGVLSLGRLVQQDCDFYWYKKGCLLTAPNRNVFLCKVEDDVPILHKPPPRSMSFTRAAPPILNKTQEDVH